LQGVDSLKLIVRSFSIGINRTSVTGGDRLNWNQESLAVAGLALTNDSPTLRIGGSAGFAIAGVVYGSATVDFNQRMISGVDDPDDAGSLLLKGSLLGLSIRNAELYIGSGAVLNEDSTLDTFGTVTPPASDSATAVGFSVSGGSLDLGIFTTTEGATDGVTYHALPSVRKYTGLKGTLGRMQLQGVDDLQLVGKDLAFQMNRSSVDAGKVLDWTQGALVDTGVGLKTSDPTFRISGTVGLGIAQVVYGSATVEITRSTLSTVMDPPIGTSGAVMTGDLMTLKITGARLYLGTGGSLNVSAGTDFGTVTLPASNDAQAIGFSVDNGAMNLGIFTTGSGAALRKYVGLKAELGKAQLQGVDAVKIIATRLSFQMNRTSAADGVLMDWSQAALTSTGVGLTPKDVPFQIGGTVGLSIADVVMGNATLNMTRGPVSAVLIPGSTAATSGNLLTLAVTQANLYIGNGATFDIDSKSGTFGTVVLPASNDPAAVGFAVETVEVTASFPGLPSSLSSSSPSPVMNNTFEEP
jgi:hypothetical protein